MKKVLVTGAFGFIGSHLVESLIKKKIKVVAYDLYNSNNNWGWLDGVKETKYLKIITGNVEDKKNLEEASLGCDTIIHLAALIAIPYSYKSPLSYINTNIIGTYNILEIGKQKKIQNIIITSTSEVYGEQKYLPLDENHTVEASSPYAATKIAADNLSLSYFKSFNLPIKIIRPFNVFGPRQSGRGLIPSIIIQILNNSKYIEVGNLYPERDYTYVKDTCEAIYLIAKKRKKGNGEIFNIGLNKSYSVKNIIYKIKKIMNSKKKIKVKNLRVRPKKSEVNKLLCDNKKIKKIFSWKNKYSFEEGLSETISWFKKNKKIYKSKIYNI